MRPLRAPQGTADHRAGQPVRLVGSVRVSDVLTAEERALLARIRFVLDDQANLPANRGEA